jgi:hypothetical protein
MSKVKIQGNASGTGVVTLTAPNTNTDRTITLPDGDISLGVGIDDNATSTAITIDASENVTFTGTLNGISTTKSASGNRWGVLPEVESNGVMEVGRYIDFHETDADTSDYGARLELSGTQLISTHGIYAAAGVYLGGTGAANKLDDYEEGTFSPTSVGSSSAGSVSYNYQTGNYTKIGNKVLFQITIGWNSHSGSGNLRIQNLPFTAAGGIAGQSGATLHYNNGLTISNNVIMFVGGGSNIIYVYNMSSTGSQSALAIDTNVGEIIITGHYMTA